MVNWVEGYNSLEFIRETLIDHVVLIISAKRGICVSFCWVVVGETYAIIRFSV